jgi:hypothetical protein
MSEDFLRLIPAEPFFLPTASAQQEAVAYLKSFAPDADSIDARVFDDIRFVDSGSNLEKVTCPLCGKNVTDFYVDLIDEAFQHVPARIDARMPCCGGSTSLNALHFDWPAGFARFFLEARNAGIGGALDGACLSALEKILGCPLRQVLAHY